MTSEYVQLQQPEIVYGQKNLLESQLGILSISKRYKEYQRLRKEELVLKVALKSKIESIKNILSSLDKMLPKTKMALEISSLKMILPKRSKATLEQEIDSIRTKLSKLR